MIVFVEVGLVFSLLMLFFGMIWVCLIWGIWWIWDVWLIILFVVVVFYVGVFIMCSVIDDLWCCVIWSVVVMIIGFVDVFFIYFCVWWWCSFY